MFILPLLLSTFMAEAQLIPAKGDIPTNAPGVKYGFQAVAEARKSITPELEAGIGTELRMQGDFLFDRQWRINADAEYKLAKRFFLTGECTMIRKHRDGDRVSYRYRVGIGLKENIKFSKKFKLTLSEKVQFTHRAGHMNKYQSAMNNVAAKLKAKLTFAPSKKIELFASAEARISFTEPNLADVYYAPAIWQFTDASGSPVGEPGWFLDGFNKVKVNRFRTDIGISYKINRHHRLKLSALTDFDRELDIDSDRAGTVIKSLVNDRRFTVYAKLAYTFSF